MMVSLYLLITIAIVMTWFNQRKSAMLVFFISLLLAIFWFMHHATEVLTIQL